MARVATRVYTNQADLARLEALVLQLLQDQRVQVTLKDGSCQTGSSAPCRSCRCFSTKAGMKG